MLTRALAIVLLILGWLLTPVWADTIQGQKAISTEASSSGVKFGISLATAAFVQGEPLVATFTITNETKKEVVLPDPERRWEVVQFEISHLSGDDKLPDRLQWELPFPPRDYGWVVQPGESRVRQQDLQQEFAAFLPVACYKVRAIYRCDPTRYGGLVAADITISTPELEFSVVAGSDPKSQGMGALYMEAYKMRDGSPTQAYKAAAIMHVLSDPTWGGRFSQYAGYWKAQALHRAGDKKGYLETLKQYTKDHADAPYYGQAALSSVAWALLDSGDKDAARRAFERLPDSWERRFYLKRLDQPANKN